MERAQEALRFAIPETCIALTIFREELTARVCGLFLALLMSKFFHVLVDCRVGCVRAGWPTLCCIVLYLYPACAVPL